jgi:hypothetical protein
VKKSPAHPWLLEDSVNPNRTLICSACDMYTYTYSNTKQYKTTAITSSFRLYFSDHQPPSRIDGIRPHMQISRYTSERWQFLFGNHLSKVYCIVMLHGSMHQGTE